MRLAVAITEVVDCAAVSLQINKRMIQPDLEIFIRLHQRARNANATPWHERLKRMIRPILHITFSITITLSCGILSNSLSQV
jgi:hypothetical protein